MELVFFINDQLYDPDRIDTVVNFGDLECWTVINNTTEDHVFHIHQLDFQVIEINGSAVPFQGRQDNINIPYSPTDYPLSYAKILIPFFNTTNIGKYVYHCHILEHEDGGMMAVIEVRNSLSSVIEVRNSHSSTSSQIYPFLVFYIVLSVCTLTYNLG